MLKSKISKKLYKTIPTKCKEYFARLTVMTTVPKTFRQQFFQEDYVIYQCLRPTSHWVFLPYHGMIFPSYHWNITVLLYLKVQRQERAFFLENAIAFTIIIRNLVNKLPKNIKKQWNPQKLASQLHTNFVKN